MPAIIDTDTTQHLTFHYEEGPDGWITVTVEEEPAAISQGRTRDEAYANILDALHELRSQPARLESLARILSQAWHRRSVEGVRERLATLR